MRNRNKIRLNESTLHRIIKESVRNVLNEMSLHKGRQVYTNNTGSAQPDGDDWKWKYDGDTIDRYLWRMKKEAQSEGGSGPNGFPMAHWFTRNAKYYFKYARYQDPDIVLDIVPSLDVPDHEMSPEELYKTIDKLWYANQIGYDVYRQMDEQDRFLFGYL